MYNTFHRGVAQLGSARRSGRRGRWFKSSHPDQKMTVCTVFLFVCGLLFIAFREGAGAAEAHDNGTEYGDAANDPEGTAPAGFEVGP